VGHDAPHGSAGYGYCASHSRYFWSLRLTWYVPRPGCRSPEHWPTPRSTNGRS